MAKADRKGKRKGRDNFRTRVPDLGYYFIVTDTRETEENYMYGLRDSLPKDLQGRIVIKVSKAKTDELVTACKEQAAMEPQYGEPWIVFDRDRVFILIKLQKTPNRKGLMQAGQIPALRFGLMLTLGECMTKLKSIAFCCISTGEFHFPNEKAAKIAIQTVQDYQKENQNSPEMVFNVFKDSDYKIYKQLLG